MDWIIVLLIIIGVASKAGKKKKQQAQKAAKQREAGFREFAEARQGGAGRLADALKEISEGVVDELGDELPEAIRSLSAQEKRSQVPPKETGGADMPKQTPPKKLPYSKEEWLKRFTDPNRPDGDAAEVPQNTNRHAPQPKAHSKTLEAASADAASASTMDSAMGSVTFPRAASAADFMEGESPLEHAAHRQRVIAEEERVRREHAQLRELRSANLQKLRSAVVMREILDKPVSLRPRARR